MNKTDFWKPNCCHQWSSNLCVLALDLLWILLPHENYLHLHTFPFFMFNCTLYRYLVLLGQDCMDRLHSYFRQHALVRDQNFCIYIISFCFVFARRGHSCPPCALPSVQRYQICVLLTALRKVLCRFAFDCPI